jgi:hypothetical protein
VKDGDVRLVHVATNAANRPGQTRRASLATIFADTIRCDQLVEELCATGISRLARAPQLDANGVSVTGIQPFGRFVAAIQPNLNRLESVTSCAIDSFNFNLHSEAAACSPSRRRHNHHNINTMVVPWHVVS